MRWIHDVSTDVDDPPQFIALADIRRACANGVDYSGLRADEHRRRYPDLQSTDIIRPTLSIFNAALAAAGKLGWAIAAAVESVGRIEATAITPLLRFKDDVVIRIRTNPASARLDVRSASRVGRSDLGANAKRLRIFFIELNNLLKTDN